MINQLISPMRLKGFLIKEILQIVRDPSSIILGIVMPVALLFIFGYGVSLDPTNVKIAVVNEDKGPEIREFCARMELSTYLEPIYVQSMEEAEKLIVSGDVDAVVRIQDHFFANLGQNNHGKIQLIVNGVDSNRARLIEGYVNGVMGKWFALRTLRNSNTPQSIVTVKNRIWFNSTADSRNSLIPGLLTLIMTLIGILLTALVIAREWERGTMETIISTPLTPDEILIGKIIPYFTLGMIGMGLSVLMGTMLFHVPLRGSVILLFLLGGLFLLASLGIGLMISVLVKIQFIAAMISIIAGFLPAFFLSGLLFDLESTPKVVQLISYLIPAKYFVVISQTLFLAGNIWNVLWVPTLMLFLMACLFLSIARKKLVRRLPVQ